MANFSFGQRRREILDYLKLKRLEDVFGVGEIDANKNELVLTELVQYMGERCLSSVMRDAKENGGEVLRKLRAHQLEAPSPELLHCTISLLQKKSL